MKNQMLKRTVSTVQISLLLASLFFPPSPRALGGQRREDFGELERVVMDELSETNTPGAAVAIVSGEKVVLARGFGVSNIETGAPVTPDMLFRIGSATKMFTAYVLVSLVEEGKLKLNVPVGNYLKGLSPRLSQLTLHQLMTHTGGIKDAKAEPAGQDESALLKSVRSYTDDFIFTEPGEIFSYANASWNLVGAIIEAVSARPYADVMEQKLFKPLGMNSTTFRPTMAMTRQLSQGHRGFGKGNTTVVRPLNNDVSDWPSGYMFSSVNDLSRFVIAFMNGGRIEGRQVLSPFVIEKLSTPYVDVPSHYENARYGYGLFIQDYRGVRLVHHHGLVGGFGSLITMVPAQRFAVIVLDNKGRITLARTAEKALEMMLPLQPKPEAGMQPLPVSEAEMARYLGTYANAHLRFTVVNREGRLFFTEPGFEGPITKVGENRFYIQPLYMLHPEGITVIMGANNKAEYFHINMRAAKRVPSNP